jgi:hypothetical protein
MLEKPGLSVVSGVQRLPFHRSISVCGLITVPVTPTANSQEA